MKNFKKQKSFILCLAPPVLWVGPKSKFCILSDPPNYIYIVGTENKPPLLQKNPVCNSAYDDSGDDDDNSDNDDDGEVEEVIDVCLLDAGAPQLRWVEDSAFNHA